MGAPQIHGTELLRLHLQGQPKHLVVLRDSGKTRLFDAHPLVERFNRRHGTGLSVVSHEVADAAVKEIFIKLPSFAVDASIAYEKPGVGLGDAIVFSTKSGRRTVLATCGYRGQKDIALVVLGLGLEDFKREGKAFVLDIPEERLIAVPDFPDCSGWYMPHPRTGVPHGQGVRERPDARYLYRHDSSYVGLLVRHAYSGQSRQLIDTLCKASNAFGVVAQVPDADVPAIQGLLGARAK